MDKQDFKPFFTIVAISVIAFWWLLLLGAAALIGASGCSGAGCSTPPTVPPVTPNPQCDSYCGSMFDRGSEGYNDCMASCMQPYTGKLK